VRCTAKVKRRLSQPYYAAKTAKRSVFGVVEGIFAGRYFCLALRLCTHTSIPDDDAMRRIRARQSYFRKLGCLPGTWHLPFLTGTRVQAAGHHELPISAIHMPDANARQTMSRRFREYHPPWLRPGFVQSAKSAYQRPKPNWIGKTQLMGTLRRIRNWSITSAIESGRPPKLLLKLQTDDQNRLNLAEGGRSVYKES
jgi:hypothetical protein